MEQWSLFIAAVLAGGALLGLAATADRRARAREQARLSSPPDRNIPEYSGAQPSYIRADQIEGASGKLAPVEVSFAEQLAAEESDATHLPAGWLADSFATNANPKQAILSDALVLVVDAVGALRELLPALARMREFERALVIATGDLQPETLEQLIANRRHLNLKICAIEASAEQRAKITSTLGISELSRADLQAGWLPNECLGSARRWVSTASSSWFLAG